ncbi:MAG: DUF2802 domain-containing protein [Pseudobdellovibrionaceae bacterium]
MTFWGLVQVFVDLSLLTSAGFMWVKLHRPAKDDPRMSRGLQLLQSKISVLEDLSDRTETQVTQLTTLMEQKCRDIQNIIFQAEKQIQKIEAAMGKSLEVAKIFQDKIPHQEIIERQNTIKYVKAARMAHQGAGIDAIAAQVDLSRGEIEFIAKVNRDQLQFSEEELPAWAKEEALAQKVNSADELLQPLIQKPTASQNAGAHDALSSLGAQFRQAMQPTAAVVTPPPQAPVPVAAVAKKSTQPMSSNDAGVVKKVIFPKIEANNNLG